MRRFLTRVLLFVAVPVAILALLYCVTDPYKTLKPFSLEYFDDTNRDYLSSELFLMNYPEQQYDSYIFGSSRGCGFNTYHWKKFLPEGSKPFLFQAWNETLTGIEEKIDYIDRHGFPLNNVIVLIDIPGTFDMEQVSTKAMTIRDPAFSGQPRWSFHLCLFGDYLQKPSQWLLSIRRFLPPSSPVIRFDRITNDWDKNNQNRDLSNPPEKDSLKNMSELSRKVFLKTVEDRAGVKQDISDPLIRGSFIQQLRHLKDVFDRNGTDFRIVVTPGYYATTPAIAPEDIELLIQIFGEMNVFDFSGQSSLNSDYNNFSDSGHFGLYVGWYMIEEMYNSASFSAFENNNEGVQFCRSGSR